jgi:hypothetical protein
MFHPRYPLDRRLGRPQSWSGHFGKEKKIPPPEELNPGHPACRLFVKNYNINLFSIPTL